MSLVMSQKRAAPKGVGGMRGRRAAAARAAVSERVKIVTPGQAGLGAAGDVSVPSKTEPVASGRRPRGSAAADWRLF